MILHVQGPQTVMFGAGVLLGGMATQTVFRLLLLLWFGKPLASFKLPQGTLAHVSLRLLKLTAGEPGHLIRKVIFVAVSWAYMKVGVKDVHGQQPTHIAILAMSIMGTAEDQELVHLTSISTPQLKKSQVRAHYQKVVLLSAGKSNLMIKN